MSSNIGTKEFKEIVACPECGREIKHISALFGCNMEKVNVSGNIKLSDRAVARLLYHYDKDKPLELKGHGGFACFFCSDCYTRYKMGKGRFEGFIPYQEIDNLKKIVQRELQ